MPPHQTPLRRVVRQLAQAWEQTLTALSAIGRPAPQPVPVSVRAARRHHLGLVERD